MPTTDLEASTFQKRPAYRYIRKTDNLPQYPPDSDPIAQVKLFDPTSGWTWFIVSYDPETRVAYGLIHGHEKEVGDFDMRELVEYRGQGLGLPIERDLHWSPKTLSEITGRD